VDFRVEDESNDNSCLVSYYQDGYVEAENLKRNLLLTLTQQYLDEPTFNQLRTQEQLGYVVFTRDANFRDINGLRFCIQSPQKCCSHIRNSLSNHLDNMRTKVKAMTDEEFKTTVSSVLVQLECRDKNLSEVS
jgi:insulysin